MDPWSPPVRVRRRLDAGDNAKDRWRIFSLANPDRGHKRFGPGRFRIGPRGVAPPAKSQSTELRSELLIDVCPGHVEAYPQADPELWPELGAVHRGVVCTWGSLHVQPG